MTRVAELFGLSAATRDVNWNAIVEAQECPFLVRRCYKVRKSDPGVSIGTCSVVYGSVRAAVVICPTRLIARGQIFSDCLHLLTAHEPGNEFHILPEVSIPGGSVDYFLVSAREGKVRDFVGIELQTLDTTGTVWPERQRLLKELGVPRSDAAELSPKPFGMNWKMTAKTILVQMHHKVQTFQHVHKKLVLVVQDRLLAYMSSEFSFAHVRNPPSIADSMHIHAYGFDAQADQSFTLGLKSRLSTDAEGVARCLGLQADSRVELRQIILAIEKRLSPTTRYNPF